MANTQVTGPPSFHVPTFIPLVEAAQKYNLSEKALTQLIQTGKIEAVQLPNGELLVAAESNGHKPKTKEQIIREEFADLLGKPISVHEAGKKYEVLSAIYGWVLAGYIRVIKKNIKRGQKKLVDEADVAYCATVYKERLKKYGGQLQGVPIFDEYGNPYELKYEDLAERRRIKRQAQKREIEKLG